MSFAPALPSGGLSGWSFLMRTIDRQKTALAGDPAFRREADHFREGIGRITSAEALVKDRRLLQVALTAFGLEGDLANRAFVQKILEGGTLDPQSLANRLADRRYAEFARAFGFGDFPVPNTQLSSFPDRILDLYVARRFEAAVGSRDGAMRLALNARRELSDLAGRQMSDTTRWFSVLGAPPLREVWQTALGLPAAFTRLDIDRQVAVLRDRSGAQLGISELSALQDPRLLDRLIQRYLVRVQTGAAGQAAQPAVLALVRGTGQAGALLSRYA